MNAASGLCLDDRDGVSSNGATVQQWACNTTSTTMQWASWAIRSDSINLLIANRRAMLNRDTFVTLEVASGSTADNAPVQLFDIPGDPPGRPAVGVQPGGLTARPRLSLLTCRNQPLRAFWQTGWAAAIAPPGLPVLC